MIVVVEDNSLVIYVENYIVIVEELNGVVNIVMEVFVNSNVKVMFGVVDYLVKGIIIYVNCCGVVGKDGCIEWVLGLMSEGNIVLENIMYLMGDGLYGDIKMVIVGCGE